MFDIQKAIKNSHLPKKEILHLQVEIKKEFPDDQMLYELHMIRALGLRAGKSKGLSKAKRFSLTGALFFVLISSNCFAAAMGVPSKEALLKEFQAALNAKNEEAIMNMSCWGGIEEKVKSAFQKKIKLLFHYAEDIKCIEFNQIAARDQWEYDEKGIRSRPNL